jgi:hypothetical protein
MADIKSASGIGSADVAEAAVSENGHYVETGQARLSKRPPIVAIVIV